jgi:hypothetical protein
MKRRISLVLKLGKPAVLSTESLQAYKEQVDWYELTLDPTDPYEVALVRDVIDAGFEVARYGRLKVALIESKVHEIEAKRAQALAEKREVIAKRVAAKSSAPASEPQEALDHLVEEVDAILLGPVSELEHARAFQAVLTEYEIVDRLQMRAIARRDNAIVQLERYREGMGKRYHNEMIAEIMAESAAGRLIRETPPDINRPAQDWVDWMERLDTKPQPTAEVPATRDAQQASAQPQKLAAVTDPPLAQPAGIDKEPAPAEASAAADAQKLRPAEPESEHQQARQAPSATDVQQAAAQPQNLAAVPDAPAVAPGGVDKEPAPGDASAAFEAPKLQPAMPGHELQQKGPSATDVQQADAHTQKLAAVPDAPDVQPGGVDKEPAPADASAAADAPKLQPAMPENAPQKAREAPSATNEQPQ